MFTLLLVKLFHDLMKKIVMKSFCIVNHVFIISIYSLWYNLSLQKYSFFRIMSFRQFGRKERWEPTVYGTAWNRVKLTVLGKRESSDLGNRESDCRILSEYSFY